MIIDAPPEQIGATIGISPGMTSLHNLKVLFKLFRSWVNTRMSNEEEVELSIFQCHFVPKNFKNKLVTEQIH